MLLEFWDYDFFRTLDSFCLGLWESWVLVHCLRISISKLEFFIVPLFKFRDHDFSQFCMVVLDFWKASFWSIFSGFQYYNFSKYVIALNELPLFKWSSVIQILTSQFLGTLHVRLKFQGNWVLKHRFRMLISRLRIRILRNIISLLEFLDYNSKLCITILDFGTLTRHIRRSWDYNFSKCRFIFRIFAHIVLEFCIFTEFNQTFAIKNNNKQ